MDDKGTTNLYFKNSWSHVTAEDPKQFFQMFDIYSGNVVCEGYREIFSSCEDIDAWISHFFPLSSIVYCILLDGSIDMWSKKIKQLTGLWQESHGPACYRSRVQSSHRKFDFKYGVPYIVGITYLNELGSKRYI